VLNSQVAQSSVVLQTQRRNRFFAPVFFIVMGAAFMLYASDGRSVLNLGTVLGGGFIVFGIVLAILGQRYARDLDRKA
jgi:membrane protein implicated in regulation of membrane protease activity